VNGTLTFATFNIVYSRYCEGHHQIFGALFVVPSPALMVQFFDISHRQSGEVLCPSKHA